MAKRIPLMPHSSPQEKLIGYLCALGATAIWSGNFIIARGLSNIVPPVSLAFWRWTVAVLVLLPLAIRPLLRERHTLLQHKRYLTAVAILGITLFNTLIYIGGHSTTALNLALISISFPIFILLFSRILFNESISYGNAAGVVLVLSGILLLITKGQLSLLLEINFAIGDLWMLLASIVFACYSMLLRKKPAEISIWSLQLCTFLLGLLFLSPIYLYETATAGGFELTLRTIGAILYIGIFASLTAYVLWSKAVSIIGPAKSGLTYYTLPLFSGLIAYLLLGENVGSLHLCSALLIVSGILLANYQGKKNL